MSAASALLLFALWRWRRRGEWLFALLITAAVIASFQEAPLDIFVSAYYPQRHLWTFWETFGRQVPIWATFAWIILFAGAPYLIACAMRSYPMRRVVWFSVLASVLVDVIIELPGQAAHMYYYYGHQPLSIGGFPLCMAAVNSATMTAIAVAVYVAQRRLTGRALSLAALAPIVAVPASTMSVGLPVFSVVGAGASTPLRYLGAAATLGLAATAIHGLTGVAQRLGSPNGDARAEFGVSPRHPLVADLDSVDALDARLVASSSSSVAKRGA